MNNQSRNRVATGMVGASLSRWDIIGEPPWSCSSTTGSMPGLCSGPQDFMSRYFGAMCHGVLSHRTVMVRSVATVGCTTDV